jgi:hypothetical protein
VNIDETMRVREREREGGREGGRKRERDTEICGALILYQNHRHFHGENSDGFADNLP